MEKTIIEGNKAISLFVNDRRTLELLKDMEYDKTQGADFHFNEEATLSQFKYHSSWDWLMPVLKKLGDMPSKGDSAKHWENLVCFGLATIDINLTWKKTVDFISWYNSQGVTPAK